MEWGNQLSEQTSLEKIPAGSREVPATITVPAYTVEPTEDEALPLLEYWRIIRKRQWTVLSVLMLIVVTVMIGTLKQRPVYQAKVVLQIDRESANILSFKDFMAEANPFDDSYLETAYKVLQSRTLARRVIDKLKLDKTGEFVEKPSGTWPWSSGRSGEGGSTAEEDRLDATYKRVIDNFLDRLTVTPVRRSRLVELYIDSYDPALAARIANTLASSYIDQSLEVKWEATQKASDWLSQQLVGLKAKLEKSEEELQLYAKQNAILFLDEKQSLGSQKLKQLQEEYTKAEADRIQKESLYGLVKGGDLASVPGMLENRLYQELSVKLADLKREYSEQSATFTPEYPKVKRLKSQIDEVERNLDRERKGLARRVSDDHRAAVTRSRFLKEAVTQQTKEFNEMAEKSIQYNILKREADTNRQLYDGLLQRMKEAGVSAGVQASNIRLVDQAEVPLRPARPRKLLNLALSLIVGLGLGIALAFFQEYLDNTLKTPDDVQRFLRLPTLGVIPAASANGRGKLPYGYGYGYGSRKRLPKPGIADGDGSKLHAELIGTDGNAPLSEAYRSLRTSVLLSTSGRPPRVILVTSGQPGEGKTTTVVNLAITLVQLGGRVLVVESDMRRPRFGKLLTLEASPAGLSTFLTGQSTLEQATVSTKIPNLYAIPCGPVPPNPAELLSSDQMRQLLQQAPQKFDYVLLDSPPVLNVSDARILAAQVEAVILVAHGGSTPRELTNHAKQHLVQVNANVIGVLLNNVDLSAVGYNYYYRYYRGYGYGHGYGYGAYGTSEESKS